MDGVMGRLAYIDLSADTIAIVAIPDSDFGEFLGGNGLAVKIMLERVSPGINPLSAENVLIFGTGPITGSGVQGSDRTCVAAKSPLTGLFFDSYLGGRFGSTLKQTGYDMLVITGKANGPKYIIVTQDSIEIRDAISLTGKSPEEVRVVLAAELDNFEVCATGIAGESLVRYASIVHPRKLGNRPGVAGRGGLGAVMGSKNLKAVVVQRGKRNDVTVHSKTLLKDVKETIRANLTAETEHFIRRLTAVGTTGGVTGINALGAFGTRNLTTETFERADDLSGEKFKRYYQRNITCYSCPVACGKLCELDGKLLKNPEYETLYALGGMVGLGDLEALIQANALCDEYGLDTISMGVTIAFAIECFERGLLTGKQTRNRSLRYGDANLVLSLIAETAHREGIGNLLAEGTRRLSQILGGDSWKYAYQVKGLEVAGHSPRLLKTLSIGYATNTRGGSHQNARPRYGENMNTYEGKVEQAIADQHLSAVGDSLIQCRFVMEAGCGRVFTDCYTDLLKAVTGWAPSTAELNEIGERIYNMERIFNVREGISRRDDTLPYRAMWEEIPEGPYKGQKTPPEKLEELLDSYYRLRGWDENGIPRRETLERLSLQDYSMSKETL